MPPRPFSFPISNGIDACSVHRIVSILRNPDLTTRWARRVFTRLEWPGIWSRFLETREALAVSKGSDREGDYRRAMDAHLAGIKNPSTADKSIWMLPRLPVNVLQNNKQSYEDQTSFMGLARHLAGRWAAKEAAIKAHSHRQLYMQDISILAIKAPERENFVAGKKSLKPIALIEPMSNIVRMDERVAVLRGLRGYSPRSLDLPRSRVFIDSTTKTRYLQRRHDAHRSERQVADISITHEGDMAVAICIAMNQANPSPVVETTIDEGTTPPIHQPEWGDEGWYATNFPESPSWHDC